MKLPSFILSVLLFFGITTKIQPTPSPTPRPLETYKNTQLGFSFRYPPDWVLVDNLDAEDKKLEVKSQNGFVLSASPSNNDESLCMPDLDMNVKTDSTKIMGQSQKIYLIGNHERQSVIHAHMALPAEKCMAIVEMYYINATEKPMDEFMSEDYKTAKDIISSLSLH